MDSWHAQDLEEIFDHFNTSATLGLTKTEAEKRLVDYGENVLKKTRKNGPLFLFFKQLRNPLVVILALALLATLYLDAPVDAFVIFIALLVNVVIGFIQEFRAEKAFDALVASQEHTTVVVRDGHQTVVPTAHLVPGDVIVCEIGSIVPADARIISIIGFSVSEAHLTGESTAVEKQVGVVPEKTELYEQHNMVFMGSPVVNGVARAVVIATGRHTHIGAIATSVTETDKEKTPIEKSIDSLARFISLVIFAVVVMLFVFGFLRDVPFADTLLLAIALAVSVVPEGLPAAVTAVLAIGMETILKQKGLVRNLLAAETLGSTTVILTDKTGTLTTGHMTLERLVIDTDDVFRGYVFSDPQSFLLQNALRVSNAFLDVESQEVHGNPIERAIVRAATHSDVYDAVLVEREERRLDYLSFESSRRFAAALYKHTEKTNTLYITGAPELLLAHATHIYEGGKSVALPEKKRQALEKEFEQLASEGKRLVASAYKTTKETCIGKEESCTEDLLGHTTFAGFLVFSDPVRHDVVGAIQEVQSAGVRVIMVTGDTPQTALSIARQSGITQGEKTLLGSDIEQMDDYELLEALKTVEVFARVLPHQKRRLVRVLQENKEVVAMTGDGVNDAPALKAAAIGIAVGSGSEVARGASDLVLLDDSFSIIVAAIREGRRILDNLKKAVTHLVTTSFHEVFIIGFAVVAGLPLPILPLQILWVNILEEGFLTFGFAFEPGEKEAMKQNPRSPQLKTILTKQVRTLILVAGTITGLFSVGLFAWLLSRNIPIEEIRTIMFVVLSVDSLLFAISLKQLRKPLWTVPLWNNRYLLFALLFSTAGIIATLSFEPLRTILELEVPNAFDIFVLLGVAVVNILTIEFTKKFVFRQNNVPHEIIKAT